MKHMNTYKMLMLKSGVKRLNKLINQSIMLNFLNNMANKGDINIEEWYLKYFTMSLE